MLSYGFGLHVSSLQSFIISLNLLLFSQLQFKIFPKSQYLKRRLCKTVLFYVEPRWKLTPLLFLTAPLSQAFSSDCAPLTKDPLIQVKHSIRHLFTFSPRKFLPKLTLFLWLRIRMEHQLHNSLHQRSSRSYLWAVYKQYESSILQLNISM